MLSEHLNRIFIQHGQAALEVPCSVDEYREFITIYVANPRKVIGFANRYPYFDENKDVYRLLRFRVHNSVITDDIKISNAELADLQQIMIQDVKILGSILAAWSVLPEAFVSPAETEIPV